MNKKIEVIIPTYKPDKKFEKLIFQLQKQTVRPERIVVINTQEELWDEAVFDKTPFVFGNLSGITMILHHISAAEFNHGGTRKWAASESKADYLLFMTQDAIPEGEDLIENLVQALEQEDRIGAAYARQLPTSDCGFLECYTRSFNYGENSRVKSKQDLDEMGIKTFFCSNVCAMYKKEIYDSVGGFPSSAIFNEDMICAGHMIQADYKIAYAAEARVIHSHNYKGAHQFKRNFDLAVSQTDFPEVFSGIRSESEGMKLVRQSAEYLIKQNRIWLIPGLIWQSGCKYLGYRLGKRYQNLPGWMILKCTSNISYWKQ